jgi:hypothetical protein
VATKLWDANLERATLQNATLWFARLSGSNLKDADLTDARLENAYFGHINLHSFSSRWESKQAKGLTQEQIDVAIGNEYTVLPKGLKRPKSWLAGKKPDRPSDAPKPSDTDNQPCLILKFKGDAKPKTLQTLSRDATAWTDYLTRLASLEKSDPIIPISEFRKGSLTLTILPGLNVIFGFGSLWLSVLMYRKMSSKKDSEKDKQLKEKLPKTKKWCIISLMPF